VKLIGQSLLAEILPVWSVAQPQTASAAPTTSHRAFPVDNTDMAHLRIDPSRIRASTRNLGALKHCRVKSPVKATKIFPNFVPRSLGHR